MALFNRIVGIGALLGLIACSLLTAAGFFLPEALRERLGAIAASLFALPSAMPWNQRLLAAIVAALVALLAFVLLVLELRPTTGADAVRVRGADGSETTLARSAIVQRVQHAIDRLDDVVEVEPRISGQGNSLVVHLEVLTAPYIDVPMKSEEIRAATREVVEQQMGLTLRRVTVTIDHAGFKGETLDF